MREEAPIRPEVVDAIFAAIQAGINDGDVSKALQLAQLHPTVAERAAANDLWLATEMMSSDHRGRVAEVWRVLLKRKWDPSPSWDDLWAELDQNDLARLRDLYDAIPDPIRERLEAHDKSNPS